MSLSDSTTTATTRVLIADDEPLARERLRMLLPTEPGSSSSAECQRRPERHRRDPALAAGPGVPRRADARRGRLRRDRGASAPGAMPLVVFVTAYDQLRAAGVRRPRARLPAQAVRPRALPRRRSTRARHQLERPSNGDLERRLLALVQDLEAGRRAARPLRRSSRAAASSSSAPTRSTGSRRPATTSSCTSATTRTCSARR